MLYYSCANKNCKSFGLEKSKLKICPDCNNLKNFENSESLPFVPKNILGRKFYAECDEFNTKKTVSISVFKCLKCNKTGVGEPTSSCESCGSHNFSVVSDLFGEDLIMEQKVVPVLVREVPSEEFDDFYKSKSFLHLSDASSPKLEHGFKLKHPHKESVSFVDIINVDERDDEIIVVTHNGTWIFQIIR